MFDWITVVLESVKPVRERTLTQARIEADEARMCNDDLIHRINSVSRDLNRKETSDD